MKLLLFTFSLILTSCGLLAPEGKERFEEIYSQQEPLEVADAPEPETNLIYTPSSSDSDLSLQKEGEAEEKSITLEIKNEAGHISLSLLNPELKEISSVRTWFAFPPNTLEVKGLNLNTDIFDLAAPNEYMLDAHNGIIKIGLTSTQKTRDPKIKIGSFNIVNLGTDSVPLSCYDYGNYTDSHCMVLGEGEGNMLLQPEGIIIE